jgi:hypothetical protein
MGRPLELPVGVGSPVGFLSGDIGVSLCTTDSLVRFSELAPICAPLLLFTPLATSYRKGHDKDHEDDRDRDYDNDDAGAHPVCPRIVLSSTIPQRGSERRGYATGATRRRLSAWRRAVQAGPQAADFLAVRCEAEVSEVSPPPLPPAQTSLLLRPWHGPPNRCRLLRSKIAPPSATGTMWST